MKIRIKDLFSKNRKILYMLLSIVLVSILSLTIVYAALNTVLNITGNAEVVGSSWDIHLDNIKVTGGSVGSNVPTITNKTTASFTTTLNNPGDFYEFTIDIVNSGSIDAMIDSISKTPELTSEQAKYLNYIIEYQNGESITTKQSLEKNSFVRLKVKVEFRKDISASNLPTQLETLNLAFSVNYVQSDGTESNVKDNGIEVKLVSADGSIDTIGTVVTIGDQQFYTIGTEDDKVKLLSKYNLYVGGEYNSSWTAYGDEATGKQDSTMLGYSPDGSKPYKGTTAFSSDSQKGTNYSDYNGSIVEGDVNNYKNIIETEYGVNVVEARLITYEELLSLGCSRSDWSCNSAPSFIYSTSYWASTAHSSTDIWNIDSYGEFDYNSYTNNAFGVRPVIIISKSLF